MTWPKTKPKERDGTLRRATWVRSGCYKTKKSTEPKEWNNSHQLLCNYRQQKADMKSHPSYSKELIFRKHAEVVWALETLIKTSQRYHYLTRKIVMLNGSYASVSMKRCFRHLITMLLVFLVTSTRILHPTSQTSRKKKLQQQSTAVIYSLIRRSKKLIYSLSNATSPACLSTRLWNYPPPNYSHIFLFFSTFIQHQPFPPLCCTLQANNFFWSEY